MLIPIAVVVILPIIMLIAAPSLFDEPIKIEPSVETPPETTGNAGVMFFVFFTIWILMLARILYKVGKGTFRVRKGF